MFDNWIYDFIYVFEFFFFWTIIWYIWFWTIWLCFDSDTQPMGLFIGTEISLTGVSRAYRVSGPN